MNKFTALAGLLLLVLVVSIGFNAYQFSLNGTLSDENRVVSKDSSSQASELEMVSILTQVKVNVDAELHKIGSSVVYASQQLSSAGLEGDLARAILTALAANSSFIATAGTSNLDNILVSVEPSANRNAEGRYIGEQDYINAHSHNPIEPTLTNVLSLVQGFNGSVIVAPIFGYNGSMIGAVSVLFNTGAMIETFVNQAVAGTHYTMWTTQTDGLVIYDADSDQRGLMLFSDGAYADFPQMLSVMHQIVDESAGHNMYQYLRTLASGQFVTKDCYWTTMGAYGTEWRMVIVHVLDA